MKDRDAIQARIAEELRQITFALEAMTGLVSRWNGRVEVVEQADFKGKKRYSCDILVDAALAEQDARWRTLIHEALHALSADYEVRSFRQNRGWEEGVVEQMQRLLRPRILARLGVSVEEALFAAIEQDHLYNVYIEALEAIRREFEMEEEAFYLLLLKTPIKDRYTTLLTTAFTFQGERRTQVLRTLSAANPVLKGDIP